MYRFSFDLDVSVVKPDDASLLAVGDADFKRDESRARKKLESISGTIFAMQK